VRLAFTDRGWEDFEWWIDNDRQTLKRIRKLITEALRTPKTGTGKPEHLRYFDDQTHGEVWSRRITQEHRFVYEIRDDLLIVLSLRHHYT